jgi:hypothetical protein
MGSAEVRGKRGDNQIRAFAFQLTIQLSRRSDGAVRVVGGCLPENSEARSVTVRLRE